MLYLININIYLMNINNTLLLINIIIQALARLRQLRNKLASLLLKVLCQSHCIVQWTAIRHLLGAKTCPLFKN